MSNKGVAVTLEVLAVVKILPGKRNKGKRKEK